MSGIMISLIMSGIMISLIMSGIMISLIMSGIMVSLIMSGIMISSLLVISGLMDRVSGLMNRIASLIMITSLTAIMTTLITTFMVITLPTILITLIIFTLPTILIILLIITLTPLILITHSRSHGQLHRLLREPEPKPRLAPGPHLPQHVRPVDLPQITLHRCPPQRTRFTTHHPHQRTTHILPSSRQPLQHPLPPLPLGIPRG